MVAPRLQRSHDRKGLTDALAFVSLLKRSMSTIAACLATLRVVEDRYGTKQLRERRRALSAYRRRMARFGVLGAAEEAEIADLEAEEMAASLEGTTAELHELIRLGDAAAANDPKLAALVLEVRLIRLRHPGANILVYTEYADSQRAAVAALTDIGGSVLTISGSDSEADRTAAAERCAEEDGIVLVSTDFLAEGLNLHQRCFHLIHLDLPYNPNRLEQRNGRIDRYGQRNDPEIRYLFLAGTFEERLLLRLIAKYEKARACLSFMPNTLNVDADPASLHEPLFAGFAEDLFSAMPRLVHSLDLAAEDTDSESYRDLLREIDRAFQSFDQLAVRHAWLSGGEGLEPAPQESQRGIDLTAFVRSVLVPEADGYRVPPAWGQDLHGLPGFDQESGVVRLTDDPERMRDSERAAAGVSRAVAPADPAGDRLGEDRAGQRGTRAEAIVADNLCSGSRIASPHGVCAAGVVRMVRLKNKLTFFHARMIRCLRMGCGKRSLRPGRQKRSRRLVCARSSSEKRIASVAAAAHQNRLARDDAVVRAWLVRRANELCGPVEARTGDLFSPGPSEGDWRSCEVPGTADGRVCGRSDGTDRTTPRGGRRPGTINSADRRRSRVRRCGLWVC